MEAFEQARDLFLEGLGFFQQAQYSLAETKFHASLALLPDRVSTLNNLSATLIKLEKFEEARPFCMKAVSLDKNSQEAWLNLGLVCKAQDDDEAIRHFDRALGINPGYAEAWSNKGAMLYKCNRTEEALACSEKALDINPHFPDAWLNHGNALQRLGRHQEALTCFDKSIALRNDFVDGWYNRTLALTAMKRYDEALTACEKVIALNRDFAGGWYSKGLILSHFKQHEEAIACYDTAKAIKPDLDYLHGVRLYAKMGICDWNEFATETATLAEKLHRSEKVSQPFPVLAMLPSADMHRKAGEIWSQDKHSTPVDAFVFPVRHRRDKIRLAYCSADFRNHAVSALTAELFELHNRDHFEVIALSFGIDQNDGMRERLTAAFDRFIDMQDKTDSEIVQFARDLEIDIAIDLGGYTQDARIEIFAQRIAPIQINYLGYPATSGASFIDYVIGDPVLIPPECERFYSEKIVRMPHSFQVNDTKRAISNKSMSRQTFGLPEHAFVFCCFNNNYKITPAIFDSWMNILSQTDDSVLWLLKNNSLVATNLRKEAEKRGIDADRLIFGGSLPHDEYLARYRHADLFLDTTPFNAGTTASDALWAGLPLITVSGEGFASRMAASLLHAIDLPELVTDTHHAYEALAVELAGNPVRMTEIRQRLAANRTVKPLFDTPLFARHIEAAYTEMHARHLQDLPPDHILVKP